MNQPQTPDKQVKTYRVTPDEAYPVWNFVEEDGHGDEVQLNEQLVKRYLRAQKAYDKAWGELHKALKDQHCAAR